MNDFGYCTNVHSGKTLDEVARALDECAVAVRHELGCRDSLAVGLWFSQTALNELERATGLKEFSRFLKSRGLKVQSLNGFPYGDFHQPVVKHAVYRPTWADSDRVDYTCRLIDVLSVLLEGRTRGTISTLPLGWPERECPPSFADECARNLLHCAAYARDCAEKSGCRIRLCLEPEPGCCLATSGQLVDYFRQTLWKMDAELSQQFLGVCHDVCHAVVMGETQDEAVGHYREAEIAIGKVQVSSALIANWDSGDPTDQAETARRLAAFAEPRYLHQTMANGRFYEDLPAALAGGERRGEWRVHFHLPIFCSDLGAGISASQSAIDDCVRLLGRTPDVDWEVETYAWGVLPESLRPPKLSAGIAAELDWLAQRPAWKYSPV